MIVCVSKHEKEKQISALEGRKMKQDFWKYLKQIDLHCGKVILNARVTYFFYIKDSSYEQKLLYNEISAVIRYVWTPMGGPSPGNH